MLLSFIRWIIDSQSVFISEHTINIIRVFSAFTFAFLTISFFGKKTIRLLKSFKIGDKVEKEYCEILTDLHKNKNDTPTMGGILMAVVFLTTLLFCGDFSNPINRMLIFVILSSALLGFRDDFLKLKRKKSHGLSAKKKVLGQAVIAGSVAFFTLFSIFGSQKESSSYLGSVNGDYVPASSGLYVPFRKTPLNIQGSLGKICAFLLIMFVMIGSSNAVNLTDGLDGLAIGTAIPVIGYFLFTTWVIGNMKFGGTYSCVETVNAIELAVFSAAVLGGCFGFLIFNHYPARLFMGDTGSLMLGNLLGFIAVVLRRELFLAIIGGVFVAEALSVIIQVCSCKWRRKRIFLCSPLHHHFEYLGWSEKRVVFCFWGFSMLLCFLGLIVGF
ncbi:MAG: phospho-N-acetylmuramoyl-pentapeptide-transferase [Victivallaceae bacterium]